MNAMKRITALALIAFSCALAAGAPAHAREVTRPTFIAHVRSRSAHPRSNPSQSSPPVPWPGNPFAANSVWNRLLRAKVPVSPESHAYVRELIRQVTAYEPWVNTWAWSTPVYLVPASEPTTHVTLDTWGPDLQSAFDAVPIPRGARPAVGTDEQLTVWQPSTNTMWEFWKLHRARDGWHARWGGEMQDVSENPGYFTHDGLTNDWGATATGLPLLGGLITFADLKRGYIDHALGIALVEAAPRYFAWPAQRTDGYVFTPGVAKIPEGTRFRLDPSLDVSALDLPPLDRMLALAAQKYGIIVRDHSGSVSFYGQEPTTPVESRAWATAFQGQYPSNLLALFPWRNLEVLAGRKSCCW